MPLPQPLPEDVTKDGRDAALDGVKNGFNWAQQNKQLALQQEELEYKYKSLEQSKAESLFGIASKYADMVKKVRELPPSVGKTIMKAWSPNFEALGFPISEVTKSIILDEESAKTQLGLDQALSMAYASGDPTAAVPALTAYMESWGSEAGANSVEKFNQNMAATERATQAQAAAAKNAAAAQAGADKRAGMAQEGQDKRQQGRLEAAYGKEYRDLREDYAANEKPYKTIFQIVKDDPTLKNPQARFNLVTTARQLFEGRPSSVQMGELQSIVRQQPGYQQWIDQAKNLLKPGQVTAPIARDTYALVKGAYEQFKDRRTAMMDRYYKGAQNNGFNPRRVMGDDVNIFTKGSAPGSKPGGAVKAKDLKGDPGFEKSVGDRVKTLEKKLGKKLSDGQVSIVRQQLAGSRK